MLNQKKVAVYVTGGIAAYKALLFVRLLIKEGAQVKVAMTQSACQFVSPLTFQVLTKEKVMDEVCRYYNINKEEILSKKRTSDVVKPRDAFRFILAKGLNMEIGKIGKILNTDHSAVSKAIKKVEETTDKELKADIAQIRIKLGV